MTNSFDRRSLTKKEATFLRRLLSLDFSGAETLRRQVNDIEIALAYVNAEYELFVCDSAPKVPYGTAVPVEAFYEDLDGARIDVLLHIQGGCLRWIDLTRGDGRDILSFPPTDGVTHVALKTLG